MKHLLIKPGLYLQQQIVPKEVSTPKVNAQLGTVNHIWIYDRSGSMSGTLRGLCSDLSNRAKSLPKGDTITLGWFSGEGQFNFILKGFKISDESDNQLIEKAIMQNNTTVGATCFSEILADTKNVVKDLAIFSDVFALMLFTDGYPVVSNYSREIDAINSAIDSIKGKITSSMLVGYGNYYNKELMSKMAEQLGGALVHSSQMAEFNIHLNDFIESSVDSMPSINVDLKANPVGEVISINKKSISLLSIDTKHQVKFSPTKSKEDNIFYLTTKPVIDSKEVKLTDATFNGNSDHDSLVRGLYAVAYVLTQKAKVDEALDVLALTGDKAIIDSVLNAFTNEEYGKSEQLMRNALMPSRRMSEGRTVGYVPPRDVFCLVDLIDVLINDEEAKFFPTHDAFCYNRIGRKSEQDPNYPKFVKDKYVAVPFENLTWNKKMLNLSVLAEITGEVDLGTEASSLGLRRHFKTRQFRNYAIVKDGFANVNLLPVTVSDQTAKLLYAHGLVDDLDTDGIYHIDIKKLPTMNRAYADGKTSAKKLFSDSIEEVRLASIAKVYKNYLSELEKSSPLDSTWRENVEAFLLSKGIKKGVYSPPKTELPSTDSYLAKEFEIKIKGLSSIPSIGDVEKKLASKKTMTPSEKFVWAGIESYNNSGVSKMSVAVQKAWLKEELNQVKMKLRAVRKSIQKTKFAVVLGKRWFNEFTSREDCVMEVEGFECSMSLREVKVEI